MFEALIMGINRQQILAAFVLLFVTGCSEYRHRDVSESSSFEIPVVVDFVSRMPAEGLIRIYRSTDPDDLDAEPFIYQVVNSPGRRVEGELTGRDAGEIAQYMALEQSVDKVARFRWPRAGKPALGLFLEFDPPLLQWPASIIDGETIVQNSRFRLFGAVGQPVFSGKVKRSICFEGYEEVEAGETTYQNCARLQVETTISVPWLASLTMKESVWLSAGLGEVKRSQHWWGRFLIFAHLQDSVEHELIHVDTTAFQPPVASETKVNKTGKSCYWRRCVAYFRPGWPIPKLRGLWVLLDGPIESKQ